MKFIKLKNCLLNFFKNKKGKEFYFFSLLLFCICRFLILNFPPKDYSDVSHFHERYANIWWYGLPPYKKHLFEYGPLAALLIIIPLFLDLKGIGYYYLNYRIQMFLIEFVFFIIALKAINKFFSSKIQKYLNASYLCLSALIAKDFWYEGVDVAFISSLCLALLSFFLLKQKKFFHKVIFWIFFCASVAIKLITFPLIFPFFILRNKNFLKSLKEEINAFLFGFIIVWGLPLVIFRSSLIVPFLFHLKRPLHASSFPAFIVYTINHFTKSEIMEKLEWFGPLSVKMLKIFSFLLIFNTLFFMLWCLIKFFQKKPFNHYLLLLKLTIVYIFIFIFSSKIISPPFHIWHTLLLTIFPYKNKKIQLLTFFFGIWALIFNTTNIVKLPQSIMIGPFSWYYLRHLLRFPPLIALPSLIIYQTPRKNDQEK